MSILKKERPVGRLRLWMPSSASFAAIVFPCVIGLVLMPFETTA